MGKSKSRVRVQGAQRTRVRLQVVAALLVVAALIVFWIRRQPPNATEPTSTLSATVESTNTQVTAPVAAPDSDTASDPLTAVLGRWLRPDGGYIVEIQRVRGDGQADVAYFNPDPIHVSRAEVKRDGAGAQVWIELRDVNYPGCIYRLNFDPARNELAGTYYQAALEQQFDVVFVREH